MMKRCTSDGGVEEKKDDMADSAAVIYQNQQQKTYSMEHRNDSEEQNHGFQAQLAGLAKVIFGSCGTAMEAASIFAHGQGCRWPIPNPAENRGPPPKPPLSIADELRRLAALEGREYHPPRRADIPQFLGEEDMLSFEDDNISALSQNTLEELALGARARAAHKQVRRMQKKLSSSQSQDQPPSPVRVRSHSQSSEDSRYGPKQDHRRARDSKRL